jgi:hypothetical protein
VVMGPKVFIYLGGNPPDTVPDIVYDYTGRNIQIVAAYGGSDINGDGYDDYGWEYWEGVDDSSTIYLGNSILSQIPIIKLSNTAFALIGDISGDGIDDFMRTIVDIGWFLCIGGNPVNIEPCGYMWFNQNVAPFSYVIRNMGPVLIRDNSNVLHRLELYHATVPFDTIPISTFNYGQSHNLCQPNIGDINADGIDEIALPFNDTLDGPYVNIYQISHTGINDNTATELPDAYGIITCYPNPFNARATISFSLVSEAKVAISVYDITGRLVDIVAERSFPSGRNSVIWDATDVLDKPVANGVYFAVATGPFGTISSKVLYLK